MDISYSGLLGPRLRREMPQGVEQLRILPRRSWKMIGASAAALAFATLKEYRGIEDFIEKRDWFGDGMIAFLVFLWLFWFVAFVGEFFGSEIVSVARGELVISRGIGPLRRAWRYRVGGVAELVGNGPATDEKGKRHLHHILLRPKAGAVRFEYERKTLYFADWLDESEGETIVRWLKPKLPAKATEALNYDEPSGGAANFRP
jgi:hypothetical protein